MQVAPEEAATLENLRIAFESEQNAQIRYADYADKADGEGWHGVASLFRAVSRAEKIHAANHGRIMHLLGSDADCTEQPVDTRTTRENLRTALAAEVFEADIMYPAFIERARACRDVAAVRTFMWSLQAEKTHERLMNEALALVEIEDDESWVTMPREFYVCPVCGFTSEEHEEDHLCPACKCARRRFEVIR